MGFFTSDEFKSFLIAMAFTFIIVGLVFAVTTQPESELDKCARDNNVYKCEYIAVPMEAKNAK